MTETIRHLLDTFELLPEAEQKEFAFEILKRTINLDMPNLTNEELVLNAEDLFLELDQREEQHG